MWYLLTAGFVLGVIIILGLMAITMFFTRKEFLLKIKALEEFIENHGVEIVNYEIHEDKVILHTNTGYLDKHCLNPECVQNARDLFDAESEIFNLRKELELLEK